MSGSEGETEEKTNTNKIVGSSETAKDKIDTNIKKKQNTLREIEKGKDNISYENYSSYSDEFNNYIINDNIRNIDNNIGKIDVVDIIIQKNIDSNKKNDIDNKSNSNKENNNKIFIYSKTSKNTDNNKEENKSELSISEIEQKEKPKNEKVEEIKVSLNTNNKNIKIALDTNQNNNEATENRTIIIKKKYKDKKISSKKLDYSNTIFYVILILNIFLPGVGTIVAGIGWGHTCNGKDRTKELICRGILEFLTSGLIVVRIQAFIEALLHFEFNICKKNKK